MIAKIEQSATAAADTLRLCTNERTEPALTALLDIVKHLTLMVKDISAQSKDTKSNPNARNASVQMKEAIQTEVQQQLKQHNNAMARMGSPAEAAKVRMSYAEAALKHVPKENRESYMIKTVQMQLPEAKPRRAAPVAKNNAEAKSGLRNLLITDLKPGPTSELKGLLQEAKIKTSKIPIFDRITPNTMQCTVESKYLPVLEEKLGLLGYNTRRDYDPTYIPRRLCEDARKKCIEHRVLRLVKILKNNTNDSAKTYLESIFEMAGWGQQVEDAKKRLEATHTQLRLGQAASSGSRTVV